MLNCRCTHRCRSRRPSEESLDCATVSWMLLLVQGGPETLSVLVKTGLNRFSVIFKQTGPTGPVHMCWDVAAEMWSLVKARSDLSELLNFTSRCSFIITFVGKISLSCSFSAGCRNLSSSLLQPRCWFWPTGPVWYCLHTWPTCCWQVVHQPAAEGSACSSFPSHLFPPRRETRKLLMPVKLSPLTV